VLALARGLLDNLKLEAGGVRHAERLRDGYEVAILGRPNSGKSTLLNTLAGREAAITSEIAGTTRDIIEVRMDLSGLPVTFLDTAGLRETGDGIERIGIDRAIERAELADLRIFLLDDQGLPGLIEPRSGDMIVMGKGDLREGGCGVSGKTGAGVPGLLESVEAVLTDRLSQSGTLTRERHRIAIERSIEELARACSELSGGGPRVEIAAESLRAATRSLDSLVGRVDVEAVLGEIFSSFCVGK
jgi:tRNA modification GTPase